MMQCWWYWCCLWPVKDYVITMRDNQLSVTFWWKFGTITNAEFGNDRIYYRIVSTTGTPISWISTGFSTNLQD